MKKTEHQWAREAEYVAWAENILRDPETHKLSHLARDASFKTHFFLSPGYVRLFDRACGQRKAFRQRAGLYLDGVILGRILKLFGLFCQPRFFVDLCAVKWVIDGTEEGRVETIILIWEAKVIIAEKAEFPVDEDFLVERQLALATTRARLND